MAEVLEIPEGWPEDHLERLVQYRLDRELDDSLSGDRAEYAEKRARMPQQVRIREDGTDG